MKEFEKHLETNYLYIRSTSDDAEFARQNWKAALGWVLSRVDSLNLGDTFSTAEKAYISVIHNIEKELEE